MSGSLPLTLPITMANPRTIVILLKTHRARGVTSKPHDNSLIPRHEPRQSHHLGTAAVGRSDCRRMCWISAKLLAGTRIKLFPGFSNRQIRTFLVSNTD